MEKTLESALQRLKRLENSKFPILSVILSSAEKNGPPVSMLVSQLHSITDKNLSQMEQKLFKKDLSKIEKFLREFYIRGGKRSQVFFSAGEKLWEALNFEFYLPPLMIVSYSPYVGPITGAEREYNRFLVLLVDREKGRFLTVNLGKIEEQKEIYDGEVPQRVKAKTINLGRTDKIMRDIEGHLHHHLQIITKAAKEFAVDKDISFVLIGGHKEIFSKLKKVLPYPLNKMVVGEFVTDVNLPVDEILAKSKKVVESLS